MTRIQRLEALLNDANVLVIELYVLGAWDLSKKARVLHDEMEDTLRELKAANEAGGAK